MNDKHRSHGQPVRVGVIFGGRSSEHEVSLASARNVIDALKQAGHTVLPIGILPSGHWITTGDPLKQLADATTTEQVSDQQNANGTMFNIETDSWALLPQSTPEESLPAIDVIFPVLHGPYGEDGTIQGMLEMGNMPYVGCGVLASSVAMDKVVAKQLFNAAGIRQTNATTVMRRKWQQTPTAVIEDIETTFAYPLFVKPANLGSSVGVSRAQNQAELANAITLAAEFDRKIIVEEAVPNAREIEVSVLGNDDPIASIPGEIIPGHDFYDYAAKYINDSSELLIPAPLCDAQVTVAQEMAIRAFKAIDGSGLARVDFLLDNSTGEFYLNEINTMPGFTRISMYPKLWDASGISYPELVDRLVQLALERFEDRSQNRTTR